MHDPPVQCVAGIAASCTINSFGKSCPEAAAYMIIPIYSVLHVTCCLTHVYVLLALLPKASKAFANPTPPRHTHAPGLGNARRRPAAGAACAAAGPDSDTDQPLLESHRGGEAHTKRATLMSNAPNQNRLRPLKACIRSRPSITVRL